MLVTIKIEVDENNFIGFPTQIEVNNDNSVYFNAVDSTGSTYNLGTGELLNAEEVFGKIVE